VERDLEVLGVRRWKKMVTDRKNGRTLFNWPKLTPGCSASGRRRLLLLNIFIFLTYESCKWQPQSATTVKTEAVGSSETS
jgi:hypothetical protein